MRSLACFLGLTATVVSASPALVAQVQDGETKQALAGAMVMSEGSDVMAVTDSAGRCMVVSVPKRGGTLLVARTGYLSVRQPWSPPTKPTTDSVMMEISLYSNSPRVVVGRVFDAGTKLAMPGARVSVVGSELAESTRVDGGFALSQFPPGPQTLEVSFPGYPLKSFAVQVRGGETSSLDLYLLDTANVGRVEGMVVDAATREPVEGARVAVEGTGCVAVTDSAGCYAIENVPAGMNKMLVSREGYLQAYTVVRLVKDWALTVNLYLRGEASRTAPGR